MTMANNDSVYHYTSIAGLLGMLNEYSKDNQNITKWATHGLFLNDPSEFSYGAKLLDPMIKLIEEKLSIPEKERIGGCLSLDKLIKTQGTLTHQYGVPYISSFTYAKDCLPMWGMYADNGKGVMIEFDINELKKLDVFDVNCKYCSTKYDLIQHYEIIKKVYETLRKRYVPEHMEDKLRRCQGVLLFSMHLSAFLSPTIKHASYKYEQEFRLAVQSEAEPLFRERDGVIIPYIHTYIPISAVKSIYIGPNANYDFVKSSLEILFAHKRIKINIMKSEVPYRG